MLKPVINEIDIFNSKIKQAYINKNYMDNS
jgi:hypothetical protein